MNYINTGFLETDIKFAKDLEQALQEHGIRFLNIMLRAEKLLPFP